MKNGNTEVKVRVTEEAIRQAAPPDAMNPSIFTLRGRFQELANDKAYRHEFESDGSIVIRAIDIDIRTADSKYA
jgi:hypothetical protein